MTWTAAIMPDDALPPDSLVGKMLRPSWQEWPGGECPRCGYHDLEIQNTAEHGWATDGDPIRCRRCGLVGWMDVDAEDSCNEMFPDDYEDLPDDYEDLPDDWESPPPPATVEPLPLWRVMHQAYEDEPYRWLRCGLIDTIENDDDKNRGLCYAAVIDALQHWLLPEEATPLAAVRSDLPFPMIERMDERQRLRQQLTEQARIAREGQ